MVSLDDLFARQLNFLLELVPLDRFSTVERNRLSKDYILHAYSELGELLACIPAWKSWLAPSVETAPDRDALTEEIVDVFKLLMNVLLIWGITPEQFGDVFRRKSDVNEQRFVQHERFSRLLAKHFHGLLTVPIAAIDLDGVLAAYPEHWLAFLAKQTGIQIGLDVFSLHTGNGAIARHIYTRLKDEYRRSGQELQVPVLSGAVEFMRCLQQAQYQLVILSARPVDRYKRLYSDSIQWLRQRGIPFDFVVWDRDKEDRIIRELPMVRFAVEDDPSNAIRVATAGIKTYLLDRPYNSHELTAHPNLTRVSTLRGILEQEHLL